MKNQILKLAQKDVKFRQALISKLSNSQLEEAKQMGKRIEEGIPSGLKKYTLVRSYMSVGDPVVSVDFFYTDSKKGLDRDNANGFKMFVQGWKKDQPTSKVSVEKLTGWKTPKLRKKTGTQDKVADYIIKYFKTNEKSLSEGQPYVDPLSKKKAHELAVGEDSSKEVEFHRLISSITSDEFHEFASYARLVERLGKQLKESLKEGNERKAWVTLRFLVKNLKVTIALMDGGIQEPKEVALLEQVQNLLRQRR